MNYIIWDKKSSINGVSAEKFISMMNYDINDEVYIITDENNNPWIVQTFKNSPYEGSTIEEKAQNHLNDIKIENQILPKYQELLNYYNDTQEVL